MALVSQPVMSVHHATRKRPAEKSLVLMEEKCLTSCIYDKQCLAILMDIYEKGEVESESYFTKVKKIVNLVTTVEQSRKVFRTFCTVSFLDRYRETPVILTVFNNVDGQLSKWSMINQLEQECFELLIRMCTIENLSSLDTDVICLVCTLCRCDCDNVSLSKLLLEIGRSVWPYINRPLWGSDHFVDFISDILEAVGNHLEHLYPKNFKIAWNAINKNLLGMNSVDMSCYGRLRLLSVIEHRGREWSLPAETVEFYKNEYEGFLESRKKEVFTALGYLISRRKTSLSVKPGRSAADFLKRRLSSEAQEKEEQNLLSSNSSSSEYLSEVSEDVFETDESKEYSGNNGVLRSRSVGYSDDQNSNETNENRGSIERTSSCSADISKPNEDIKEYIDDKANVLRGHSVSTDTNTPSVNRRESNDDVLESFSPSSSNVKLNEHKNGNVFRSRSNSKGDKMASANKLESGDEELDVSQSSSNCTDAKKPNEHNMYTASSFSPFSKDDQMPSKLESFDGNNDVSQSSSRFSDANKPNERKMYTDSNFRRRSFTKDDQMPSKLESIDDNDDVFESPFLNSTDINKPNEQKTENVFRRRSNSRDSFKLGDSNNNQDNPSSFMSFQSTSAREITTSGRRFLSEGNLSDYGSSSQGTSSETSSSDFEQRRFVNRPFAERKTTSIKVPAKYVGRVIGARGTVIISIQEECDVKIHMVRDKEFGANSKDSARPPLRRWRSEEPTVSKDEEDCISKDEVKQSFKSWRDKIDAREGFAREVEDGDKMAGKEENGVGIKEEKSEINVERNEDNEEGKEDGKVESKEDEMDSKKEGRIASEEDETTSNETDQMELGEKTTTKEENENATENDEEAREFEIIGAEEAIRKAKQEIEEIIKSMKHIENNRMRFTRSQSEVTPTRGGFKQIYRSLSCPITDWGESCSGSCTSCQKGRYCRSFLLYQSESPEAWVRPDDLSVTRDVDWAKHVVETQVKNPRRMSDRSPTQQGS